MLTRLNAFACRYRRKDGFLPNNYVSSNLGYRFVLRYLNNTR